MQFTGIVEGVATRGTWERPVDRPESITAQVDGRDYRINLVEVEPHVYWLQWGNRSFEVIVSEDAAGTFVSIGGRRIRVEIDGARPQSGRPSTRTAAKHHDGAVELRAPMPGKIVRTLVAEGDTIQANQGIVVMEAMKMQNEIKSPKAGVVRSLAVREGAAVSAGEILATIE